MVLPAVRSEPSVRRGRTPLSHPPWARVCTPPPSFELSTPRVAETADHGDVFVEGFEGLQNRRVLEGGSPVARGVEIGEIHAVGHVEEAHQRRGGAGRAAYGGYHGVEQGQGDGSSRAAQHGASGE